MAQTHNNGVGGTITSNDASARLSSAVVDNVVNKIRETPSKHDENADYFKKIFDDYLKALDADHQAAFVEYFSKNQDWAPHFDKIKKSWSNKRIITAGVLGIGLPALTIAALLTHEGYRLDRGADGLFDGDFSTRDKRVIALIALLLVVSAVVSYLVATKKPPNSKELEGIMNNAFRNAEKTVENAKMAKAADEQKNVDDKKANEQKNVNKNKANELKNTDIPRNVDPLNNNPQITQADKSSERRPDQGGINNSINAAGSPIDREPHSHLYERLLAEKSSAQMLLEAKNAQMLLEAKNAQLLARADAATLSRADANTLLLSRADAATMFQMQLQSLYARNAAHFGNNPHMVYGQLGTQLPAADPNNKQNNQLGTQLRAATDPQQQSQLDAQLRAATNPHAKQKGLKQPPIKKQFFSDISEDERNDRGANKSDISEDESHKKAKKRVLHQSENSSEESQSSSDGEMSSDSDTKDPKKKQTKVNWHH